MIASHDSYTFMRPRRWWARLLTPFWRTQTKNLEEQRAAGVGYLDIRVRNDRGRWRVCHGLVDFDMTFRTVRGIAVCHSDFAVRILLERGSAEDERMFEQEVRGALGLPTSTAEEPAAVALAQCGGRIRFAGIKRGWRVLHDSGDAVEDFTFTPFLSCNSLWGNIRRVAGMLLRDFRSCSIGGWARRHPLPEGARDSGRVYFQDMV